MNAIYNGQDEVAKGLDIRVPVLVCTSDRSMLQTRWDPLMARADTVLDVQSVRQAAVNLGPFVTLVTIPVRCMIFRCQLPMRGASTSGSVWNGQGYWHGDLIE